MSFNKSLLTQLSEDLKKKKKPSKPSVPRNQWQHPGEVTNIPSNNITMDGVSYPVLGVPNVGPAQMMQPDQQYHFPGASNVTEHPMMRMGGSLLSKTINCKSCGHSWKSTDGGKDPLTCHKCGADVKMQTGGDVLPKMQFAGAVGASAAVQNMNKPKTPQELAAHRQRMYNTIRPSDYYDQNNYMRFMFNNQREERDDVRSEEGFRQYLGLNTTPKFITPAVYRPTQAKNPNAKYYKVDKQLEQDLFDSFHDKVKMGQTMGTDEFQVVNNIPYIKRLDDQGLYNEEDNSYYLTKTDQKLKRTEYKSRARVLGNFTVSHGKDDKGEYLSYYDTYDFPGLVQKQMQGSPYELYGRMYYPKKATGGQTRDEREMVNGIADILTQVKDVDNREQIARQMMADFERDDVTYDPQDFKEMAKLKYGGHGGLDRWFAEKWVDVKTGKACGRQEGESRKGYPACRPSKRVNSDTPKTAGELSGSEKAKFKREKTSSKRIDYNHKKEEGGQTGWLDSYEDGGSKYTVKPGQYLSQIAKANNVSVDDLVMANQISNPNLIKPGQELVIPEGANQFRMPSKEGYVGFNELMTRQKELSALPARDMIRQYRKQSQMDGNYAVVDKATGNMSIYNPLGEEVSTFPVGTGKDYGDKRTINVKGPNARNTTPAGIYTLTNKGSGRDSYAPHYGNNIWEMVDQNNMQQPTALHQVPNELPYRNSIIGDKNPTNNRITNGCINCRKKDFDTQVEKFMGKGSQIYVLPDDQNNKLVVKNNKIMLTGDKFDKDVSYSKRDLTATPLQIKWAKSQFGDAAPNVQKMAQSLVGQKQALMKDLNIDNDTYNELAQLTLGVAGQESDYGNSFFYKWKESPEGQNDVRFGKALKNIWNLKDPTEISPSSRGFTQVKYNSQNKEVRNLFAKYGIKSPDDLGDPSKSNVAALIMMGYMYNNELPQLKKQMDKLGVSKTDAILYLNQGKRSEITKGTATPDKNLYIQNVKNYGKRFVLNQKRKDGGSQNNWLEKYN